MTAARDLATRAFLVLPDAVRERVFARVQGYGSDDVPPPTPVPATGVRLLIAPANFAGQGRLWASAAARLPGVGAANMQVTAGGFAFAADRTVPQVVAARAARWGRLEYESVVRGFTHVVVESERPIFGRRFGGDVVAEVRALRAAGVRVATVSHGTDIRLPSAHRAREQWSPFPDDEPSRALEATVAANLRVLRDIASDGATPMFVSTPDLLDDLPGAIWLPVVVDAARWAAGTRPRPPGTPLRVLHAPSSGPLKGTAAILSALRRLADQRVVELDLVEGVPHSEMPARVAAADVVLDQFALGSYGVAACEAMAAGRTVVAHLSEAVRTRAAEAAGMPVPIIEATPATLEPTLRQLAQDPSDAAALRGADGSLFVERLHDGAASARALASFLGVGTGNGEPRVGGSTPNPM